MGTHLCFPAQEAFSSSVGRVHLSFKGCWAYFVAFVLILMENPVSKQCDPDQTPHYVASDLSLHCLPMILLRIGLPH